MVNAEGALLMTAYLAKARALPVGLSNALHIARTSDTDRGVLAQPTRTAVYGPVWTVVSRVGG
jgi:hypothetical protein